MADTLRMGIRMAMKAPGAAFRWLAQSKKAVVGATMLLLIVGTILLAPLIAPYSPFQMETGPILSPATAQNIMGTDVYGRDVFSRLVYGGRVSLTLAILVVLISVSIGSVLGLVSGFFGGMVDSFIMRVVDIVFSMPVILLSICVAAVLGAGMKVVVIAYGTIYVAEIVKMVRGVVLSLREQEYVEAAFISGERKSAVMLRYLLPNCLSAIIVQSSLLAASAILGEASVSYLGLGIQPPDPSWGLMLSEGAAYIYRSPTLCLFPGAAVVLTVLSINLLGDGLRDILDPRFGGKGVKQ